MGFTPLPPSKLRALGPGLQESLHSYALRMANTCGLGLTALHAFLLRDSESPPAAVNSFTPGSWIGPIGNFRRLLKSLERDTGVEDLRSGTFHVVADVMGNGGIRNCRRGGERVWCPRCLQEWDSLQSCEPLLWQFQLLSTCPLHDVVMESRCRNCKSPQPFTTAWRSRRKCVTCAQPLGWVGDMTTRDRKSRWIDGMLLDFTRWIHIQQEPVSKDAFIQVLLDRSGKGGIDKVVDGVNCRRSRHRLHSVGQRPSLSTLLNLAALKGVSIQGVLGDAQSWLPDHLFQSEFEFQDFTPRSYERSKYSSTQIGAVLRHVLGSSLPLPPTGLIWHALEIGSINAKTACPKQYAALIERARSEEPLLAKP